jgi:hypothetical protein
VCAVDIVSETLIQQYRRCRYGWDNAARDHRRVNGENMALVTHSWPYSESKHVCSVALAHTCAPTLLFWSFSRQCDRAERSVLVLQAVTTHRLFVRGTTSVASLSIALSGARRYSLASLAIALSGARRYSLVLRQPRAVGYPTGMSRLVTLARLSATMLNTSVQRLGRH